MTEPIEWIGTPEACARLGVTLRTLYRFIDEGQLPAYKMGRVIRLQAHEVDAFIKRARIVPGHWSTSTPTPGRRGHKSMKLVLKTPRSALERRVRRLAAFSAG